MAHYWCTAYTVQHERSPRRLRSANTRARFSLVGRALTSVTRVFLRCRTMTRAKNSAAGFQTAKLVIVGRESDSR